MEEIERHYSMVNLEGESIDSDRLGNLTRALRGENYVVKTEGETRTIYEGGSDAPLGWFNSERIVIEDPTKDNRKKLVGIVEILAFDEKGDVIQNPVKQ